jgi:hypothetical protein
VEDMVESEMVEEMVEEDLILITETDKIEDSPHIKEIKEEEII